MDLPEKQERLKISELRFQLKKVEREHKNKLKVWGIIKDISRHLSWNGKNTQQLTSKTNKFGSLVQ